MGRTIVTVAGWGIVLNQKQQKKLEKAFLEDVKKIHLAHPFRDSPWFPYENSDFFFFDAFEEYYENTLQIQGGAGSDLLILAKSTSLLSYDGETIIKENLNTTPKQKELANINYVVEKTKYTKNPTWVMKTFIY